MTRGLTTILIVLAAVAAAVFLLPKFLQKGAIAAPPPPPPPPPPAKKGKKTIFGKIVAGIGQVATVIPHPIAQQVAQGAGTVGGYTV